MNTQLKSKELIYFFRKNSDEKLRVQDISFDNKIGYNCISISATINGEEISGFGQAKSKDKAMFIAIMELTERFIFKKYFINIKKANRFFARKQPANEKLNSSNGVAVHFCHKKAIRNGTNELIERHTILKALAEKIYPARLNDGIQKYQKITKYPIEFYVWQSSLKRYVVLIRAKHNNKCAYGFGCGKNLKQTLESSFLEFSPRIALFDEFGENSHKPFITANPHMLQHWNETAHWTDDYFAKASSIKVMPKVDQGISYSDLTIGYFDLCKDLKSIGVKAVVVDSVKMQPLFTGAWKKSKINPLAICSDDLPPELHMIG